MKAFRLCTICLAKCILLKGVLINGLPTGFILISSSKIAV